MAKELFILFLIVLFAGCGESPQSRTARPLEQQLDLDLRKFFALKEAQARELEARDRIAFAKDGPPAPFVEEGLPPVVWKFFAAGKHGDWAKASGLFEEKIAPRSFQFEHPDSPDERYATTAWQSINEAHFIYRQLVATDPKHLLAYGRTIVASLPSNSVYFAGTDAGRFVVEFVCRRDGATPSFVMVSQNQMSDDLYLEYLRATCEGRIKPLTSDDAQKAFTDYLATAQRRLEANELKPGEYVSLTNGTVQVSGPTPVFEVIAQLARILVAKNPGREFFIDQQVILDWTYPYAEPFGFILKINGTSLPELSAETVQRDQEFWRLQMANTVGNWVDEKTTENELCDWAEKVFLHGNLAGFEGDPEFVRTAREVKWPGDIYGASAVYSKSRANIAELYAWRALNAVVEEDKKRMQQAADLAFHQAFALCPTQTDTVKGFYNFLWRAGRFSDALSLVQCAGKFCPENQSFQAFVNQVAEAVAKSSQ